MTLSYLFSLIYKNCLIYIYIYIFACVSIYLFSCAPTEAGRMDGETQHAAIELGLLVELETDLKKCPASLKLFRSRYASEPQLSSFTRFTLAEGLSPGLSLLVVQQKSLAQPCPIATPGKFHLEFTVFACVQQCMCVHIDMTKLK